MSRLFPHRLGIHARVMSTAMILICGATLTLGYIGVNIINDFVTQRFDQRINVMTQYLAMNSELGILIDEHELLRGLAQNMLKEADIQGVKISDQTGEVLIREFRQLPGPFRRVEKDVYLSNSDSDADWLSKLDGSVSQRTIGRVQVTYSTQGIDDLVLRMTRRFIYSAVVLILVTGIMFYVISRSIVSPVISLANTARQVSKGHRDIRAMGGSTPEISKLANAFNDMLDSLAQGRQTLIRAHKTMARQKTLAEVGKFSMMIAHEVKNPLAIIKSSLEMLKSDLNIPADNIPLRYAEGEVVRLNELIESFLMFSRPVKPKFSEVDLNRLVDQVMMGFDIQHNSGQLTLESEIPDTSFFAEADFDLLSRAINNIIKNACEANNYQGTVSVRIKARHNKWQLYISDQGPGVATADKKKIFDPFFTTKSKGTGLGLAFVDHVVKAHGGSVIVEDVENSGCCFIVTLFSSIREPNTLDIENMEKEWRTY